MNGVDVEFLTRFLKERSGLVLVGDKTYLIESRLLPIVRRHNLGSLAGLMQKLRAGNVLNLEREVVEAMTTNETFFFRDKIPFELFGDTILPQLAKARAGMRKVRIWCAACSSGQEPYSLAMMLAEAAAQFSGWDFEIVATDLSGEILDKAKAGKFSQFEVQRGLPIQFLVKYFAQKGDRVGASSRNPAEGAVPADQPAAGLLAAGQLRRRVLPQRADLFRRTDKDRRPQSHGEHDSRGRLHGSRGGRDGGWAVRAVPRFAGEARPLRPQCEGRSLRAATAPLCGGALTARQQKSPAEAGLFCRWCAQALARMSSGGSRST